jgi:hypothetical protein
MAARSETFAERGNTPTATPTASSTPVASNTPTSTVAVTATNTPKASKTPTPTVTPTATPQPVFSSATFIYDGDGKRVKSVITTNLGTTTTYFVSNYYEVTGDGQVTKYYFAGAQRQ